MKRFELAGWVLLGLAVFLVVARIFGREHLTTAAPKYCNKSNSCSGQGCSISPSGQPCDRSRTNNFTFPSNDPDWGDILGGETIPQCVGTDGMTPIPSAKCSTCSVCGSIYPPNGNALRRICVPLTPDGCLAFTPPAKLLTYINSDPGALTCCGLGKERKKVAGVRK